MYHCKTTRHSSREVVVKEEDFKGIVTSVGDNLKEIAKFLSSEIRERFPQHEILEAMGIVYPQFWVK